MNHRADAVVFSKSHAHHPQRKRSSSMTPMGKEGAAKAAFEHGMAHAGAVDLSIAALGVEQSRPAAQRPQQNTAQSRFTLNAATPALVNAHTGLQSTASGVDSVIPIGQIIVTQVLGPNRHE